MIYFSRFLFLIIFFILLGCENQNSSSNNIQINESPKLSSNANDFKQSNEETSSSALSQNQQIPMKGFNDALKESIQISNNNPIYIEFIISNATPNDIAMCTALGMKAAAFSAFNPNLLDAMVVKVHALNAGAMMLSHKALDEKGIMPNGLINTYVNIFKPMDFADILEKNWATCDHIMAGALKKINQQELTYYLKRPYIN